ncbi:MAG: Aspartate transaminase, partial [Defluviitaleaceae bacterium]|nr:Aspartate transaminase [Defluviitaleaceae bacterium]
MKPEMIASTVRDIPPSGIRKFFDIANEMEDAISLGVGEPDFDTPWHIREEGIYNLEKGKTVYTSNSGLMELREEISKYLSRRFSIEYNPKTQILVTVGASEGIDLALRALLNPGDEVLIPEPSYVSYKPCTIMAGGVPVTITTKAEDEFRLTPEQLKAHITDRTKVLILPYPNNPTGGIMEKEDLEKIADILRDRDIVVISDEIYAELTYDKEHVSIASIPGMYENTLVINGFSKAYAMTGWRLGYAAGPEELIAMMTKIHQYAIMCAPTTSQYAAVEALRNGDSDVAEMRNSFNRRRRIMVDGFRKMGMDCFEPLGAFYVFPSIAKTGMTSEEFCKRLLYEQKVAVVPGTAFGESGEGFIRCSYAYSIDNIKE